MLCDKMACNKMSCNKNGMPDLDPNCLKKHLVACLKDFFEKVNFEKKKSAENIKHVLFGPIYWAISRKKFKFTQFITYQLKLFIWHIRTSSVRIKED